MLKKKDYMNRMELFQSVKTKITGKLIPDTRIKSKHLFHLRSRTYWYLSLLLTFLGYSGKKMKWDIQKVRIVIILVFINKDELNNYTEDFKELPKVSLV